MLVNPDLVSVAERFGIYATRVVTLRYWRMLCGALSSNESGLIEVTVLVYGKAVIWRGTRANTP